MGVRMKRIGDLLPWHDPPQWFPSRIVVWLEILLAVAMLIVGSRMSGPILGLSFFHWFIVLVIVFVLFGTAPYRKASGTRADDAMLREEIQRWKDISGHGR